jgi:hypothetical protein
MRVIKFTIPSVHLHSLACSRYSCQQQFSWPCTPRPWSWSLPPACRRHPRDKNRCVAWRNIHELAPLKSQVRHTHTFTLVLQSSCATTPARSEDSRTEAPQIDRMLGSHFVVDAVHLSWWSKTLGSSSTTTKYFGSRGLFVNHELSRPDQVRGNCALPSAPPPQTHMVTLSLKGCVDWLSMLHF